MKIAARSTTNLGPKDCGEPGRKHVWNRRTAWKIVCRRCGKVAA